MHVLDLRDTPFWRLILHYHDTCTLNTAPLFPDGVNVELMAIIQVIPRPLMDIKTAVILATSSKTMAVRIPS